MNSNCILWTKNKNRGGYGLRKYKGKIRTAHRVAYEETYGEIPQGMCVLHKCDVPACINPEHLFLGTFKDNAQDRNKKGRNADVRGSKNPNTNLTEEIVLKIRASTKSYRQIAKEFGTSKSRVCGIKLRQTWRHI